MDLTSITRWATEEFGTTAHHAGTARAWISMATAAARRPSGTVTSVFATSAAQRSAYRQLEREALTPEAVLEGPTRACARRARAVPFAYVPVDTTSLVITDRARAKGTGPISTRTVTTRGLHFGTAIALSPHRVPFGLADLIAWRRPERPSRRPYKKRPFAQRETRHMLALCQRVHTRWRREGVATRPWFQVDRAGDFHQLLRWALRVDAWVTVRAQFDRRVRDPLGSKLWEALGARPACAAFELQVPRAHGRAERSATLEVRTDLIEIELKNWSGSGARYFSLHAVLVREVGALPRGVDRLEWMLWTTFPVTTAKDALAVAEGYATRWSIESFHKTWKSDLCHVEDTQLRSASALVKWATLLAAVAIRSQHLTMRARSEPEADARSEFTPEEIEAVVLLRGAKVDPRKPLPLATVVKWIAELGGYPGNPARPPPGQKVIARGLGWVLPAALALKRRAELEASKRK